MKKLLILFLVLAVTLFPACSAASSGSTPTNTPDASETNPVGAEIAYPEYISAELNASSAFQEALTYPAVITLSDDTGYHVVTSGRDVRAFWENYQNGKATELRCYYFWKDKSSIPTQYRAGYSAYVCPGVGGAPYLVEGETTDTSSWNAAWIQHDEHYSIESLQLADWGCLLRKAEPASMVLGTTVIAPQECFLNYDELQKHKVYTDPIFQELVCGTTFDHPEDAGNWMGYYEDIYRYLHGQNSNIGNEHPDGNFPISEMCDILLQYFDIDKDVIRSYLTARYPYDAATDTVHYEGGRGGGYPSLRITDYQELGGESDRTAKISYVLEDVDTGEPSAGYVMTVRLLPDGTFRYLSVCKAG